MTIWIMEGFSSQRGIIRGIQEWLKNIAALIPTNNEIKVLASHRQLRPEITMNATYSLQEPEQGDDEMKLRFMENTIKNYHVNLVHTGRSGHWFEQHRALIESFGVELITGACSTESFGLADDKYAFTQRLVQNAIPHTEALKASSVDELEHAIIQMRQAYEQICVKPNKGVYGFGFWKLDDNAKTNSVLLHPEARKINTSLYLDILKSSGGLSEPMLVMPYLPGPECSIDMVVEKGQVVAAIGRRKQDSYQFMFTRGQEIDLAKRCAAMLGSDGLVNVQTREDAEGQPRILETNLRPSGGVSYAISAGANLPAIMIARRLGLPPPEFQLNANRIRIVDEALSIPDTLPEIL